MKELYYLNQNELPNIPVPHDCIIKEIKQEGQNLIFVFEDDISDYDAVNYIIPDAVSLRMTFHLIDDISDISLFRYKSRFLNRIIHRPGYYTEIPIKDSKTLSSLTEGRLEYLFHNVGYCSIIVKLYSKGSIILNITADYVQLDRVIKDG